jgi:hypothetical protein
MAEPTAEAFIQWKGTDACFDFTCQCGEGQHIDEKFAYYVRCPECGALWKMPEDLQLQLVPADRADGLESVTVPYATERA